MHIGRYNSRGWVSKAAIFIEAGWERKVGSALKRRRKMAADMSHTSVAWRRGRGTQLQQEEENRGCEVWPRRFRRDESLHQTRDSALNISHCSFIAAFVDCMQAKVPWECCPQHEGRNPSKRSGTPLENASGEAKSGSTDLFRTPRTNNCAGT